MMEKQRLLSLLPKRTMTWQSEGNQSMIDLVLALEALSDNYQHCKLYKIEHNLDHKAINTLFEIETPDRQHQLKPLFKSAPWGKTKERVKELLDRTQRFKSTQCQANRLLKAVETTVKELTPLSRPSPYIKRWWTQDLTSVRGTYKRLKNQARSTRKEKGYCRAKKEAREAARQYHKAI